MSIASIFLSFARAAMTASGLATSATAAVVIGQRLLFEERSTRETFVSVLLGFFAVFAASAAVVVML